MVRERKCWAGRALGAGSRAQWDGRSHHLFVLRRVTGQNRRMTTLMATFDEFREEFDEAWCLRMASVRPAAPFSRWPP